MKICIDLDDTICVPNHGESDSQRKYGDARPRKSVINKMHEWKRAGWHITIFTARRMLTHNGDVEAVKKDIGDLTTQWLVKYNVPYDELIFGKPYYDVIVDDKALNVEDLLANPKLLNPNL